MLDTIAIKLERSSYQINCPARFSPNAALMNDYKYGGKGIIRSVYNPTIEETRQGYLPRLTLFKKPYGEWGSAVWLKIEFSAPKLVFGNNFEELSDQGFEKVIGALHTALERMGIKVTRDSLVNGQITAIHFSKNIIMDRYTPCSLMLQMLEKADMSRRLDVSKSVFRNGGQMVSYHAKNFEIVFYDKIKDMEQAQKFGESRGAEKDYGEKLPYLTGIGRTDVLRMEVRLLTKKLKAVLTSLGITMPLTLKNLYSSNVSRAVLRHYWSEIVSGLYALNLEATACDELADNIRTKFPKKRSGTILALMGFVLSSQQIGPRGTRTLLKISDSQFYRFRADARKLDQNVKGWRFHALGKIRTELDNFVPIRLCDSNEGAK